MKNKTTLTFTGDIGFDHYMLGKWKDETLLSSEVSNFLADTDHLIVNVEGPLSDPVKKTDASGVSKLLHTMNPEVSDFLTGIKADIWNICNNHIMDAGPQGLINTVSLAKKAGAGTLGAGQDIDCASAPVIINEAGGIGLLSVGYQRACRKADENTPGCFSWSDLERIQNVITKIKKTCRWCIVVAHAGEEFTALPSPYTRNRYHQYLEMGADIVVAHHPHVPMNYETVGDKMIFYSLGNFIFDTDYQRSQYYTELGLFVKLFFTPDSFTFEPFGIAVDRTRGQIVAHSLPDIFTDIPEEEYQKLIPLSTKAFIEATKRQLRYLYPDKFMNATEEDFYQNFYEPLRSGRVPGETLDFQILYPLALEADKGAWKTSNLPKVIDYILCTIGDGN